MTDKPKGLREEVVEMIIDGVDKLKNGRRISMSISGGLTAIYVENADVKIRITIEKTLT